MGAINRILMGVYAVVPVKVKKILTKEYNIVLLKLKPDTPIYSQ